MITLAKQCRNSLSLIAIIAVLNIMFVACSGGGGGDDGGTVSPEASLSALTVLKGTLQPAFDSSVTTYLDAPVPFSDSAAPAYNDTQSASITATAAKNGATITINGDSVTSGSAYTMSNLSVGANTAIIVVTAEDGVTTATYTVTVYRAIPVFRTGQTTSYATGDDGDLEKGVSWPATRFTDNGNGTITDNMTGLVWLQDVGSSSSSYCKWANGITYCEDLTTGATDWRMPNVRELRSLVHYGKSAPYTWLKEQGFSSINEGLYNYWSSTNCQGSINAWRVHFGTGYTNPLDRSQSAYVFSVRGDSNIPKTGQTTMYSSNDDGTYQEGIIFPSTRFRDNGDGTITDNMTGLMWLKDANNAGGSKMFSNALAYVADLNSGSESGNCGYTDWRLPNVTELESVVHYGQSDQYTWLISQGFSNVQNGYYWSSTRDVTDADSVFVLLSDGSFLDVNNAHSCYILPVRGPVQ